MKKVFLTGASSGIGKACLELLQHHYEITAPTRDQFNLEQFGAVSTFDYSPYDIVINCAGVNVGTHLGFHKNNYQNQVQQVHVNYIAPLLMAKKYTQDRKSGQFIFISSGSIDKPEVYNIFNSTSKLALRQAMHTLGKEYNTILFTEICPGRTKTNMLYQNYNGTKTRDEVELEYAQYPCLTADNVAESVLYSITNRISEIKINP